MDIKYKTLIIKLKSKHLVLIFYFFSHISLIDNFVISHLIRVTGIRNAVNVCHFIIIDFKIPINTSREC